MDVENAIKFAVDAHMGQLDKKGQPYIYHPLRVMERARNNGENEQILIACLLHDVIEDTAYNYQDLINMGIAEDTVSIVNEVTKDGTYKVNTYQEWIDEIVEKGTLGSILVKTYDVLDNLERTRQEVKRSRGPTDLEKLEKRYEKAANKLLIGQIQK